MTPQQPFCQPLGNHVVVAPGSAVLPQAGNAKLDMDEAEAEAETSSSTEEDMSEQSQNSHSLTVEVPGAPAIMSKLSTIIVPGGGNNPPISMEASASAYYGNHAQLASASVNEANHALPHLENGIRADRGGDDTMTEDERKREHKKRSKNWTRAETLKLIQARAELDEKFRKSGRKVPLWEDISCSLQRANFCRDGQQCKDKWEKLIAGYKEVRDGARDKADHPFYEELHPLLSWKSYKRESETPRDATTEANNKRVKFEPGSVPGVQNWKQAGVTSIASDGQTVLEVGDVQKDGMPSLLTLKRSGSMSFMDLAVIQELLETIVIRQQRFFKELMDAVERKEQYREQMRHAREEKWRAEERAQRFAFHNVMLMLTQRFLGERPIGAGTAIVPVPVAAPPSTALVNPKKRSKNWKKSEVFHLIRFRREMESKFVKSTRRAGLWEELGEKLSSLGINRDGKQCREKWDKLMAEYKDVVDGKKDKEESPYFAELTTFVGKAKEIEPKSSSPEAAKDEYCDN